MSTPSNILIRENSADRNLYTCTVENGDAFLRIGKFIIIQVYEDSSYTLDDNFKSHLNKWRPDYRFPENITEELREYILANENVGAAIKAKFRELISVDYGIL